ncbi:MAG TPA: hypothetical protein VKS24_02910 [Bradyrhizobium sp.]|nr:hypothetical protein [Bradyrhizobium sp.]
MTTQIIHTPYCEWAERKRDFLLVSSFGLWAAVLGLTPVVALHLLMGS